MFLTHARRLTVLAGFALVAAGAAAQDAAISTPHAWTAAEIVQRMQTQNRTQASELKHYDETRHYRAEFHGFATSLTAAMEVEVTYDEATGKSFRIVSQTGSKLLCDRVLKKAIESEKEASGDKSSTALTSANYKIELVGTENVEGRPTYVLHVEPLKASKFLYRGRVWVDAADFAVIRIEGEPAKNPSFWLLRPQIHFVSSKVNGFWLPKGNRSETKVRFGGTAVLVIDYGTYRFEKRTASTP